MPIEIAPPVEAMRWEVNADGVLEVLDRHWEKVEPCVRELQAQYERDALNLTDEERIRGVRKRRT